MRTARPLLTLCATLCAAWAGAQTQAVIGKLAEAAVPTAVYSTPSRASRVVLRLSPSQRLVIRHGDRSDWNLVPLKSGKIGYIPATDVYDLPYTVYLKPRSRNRSLSSRGGVVTEATGNPLVDYALQFQGTPYEWGGNDLKNGIDCSGFVKQVMKGTIGYNMPRTAAEQALVGQPITRLEDLRPGDRLYFKMRSESKISHTGIYMGNWRFVHSSHGKGGVSTDSLTKASWRNMLVAARR